MKQKKMEKAPTFNKNLNAYLLENHSWAGIQLSGRVLA
jgi:hypothetical protein